MIRTGSCCGSDYAKAYGFIKHHKAYDRDAHHSRFLKHYVYMEIKMENKETAVLFNSDVKKVLAT